MSRELLRSWGPRLQLLYTTNRRNPASLYVRELPAVDERQPTSTRSCVYIYGLFLYWVVVSDFISCVVNFFRSRNINGNYGTSSQRILALFQKSDPFMDLNVEFTAYPAVVQIPALPVTLH